VNLVNPVTVHNRALAIDIITVKQSLPYGKKPEQQLCLCGFVKAYLA